MTAEEMQYNFELKVGTLKSVSKPWLSYDIDQFLNKAMDDIIDGRYSDREEDNREFFEKDEKVRLELTELIASVLITSSSFDTSNPALHANGAFITVPDDFLYALNEECSVTYTDCNSDTVTITSNVMPVKHDEYSINRLNPFKKPYNQLVWRLDYGSPTGDTKRHELITDGSFDIQNYTLRYLRRPNRIDIVAGNDCELNASLHEEIVDRAVRIALATVPKESVNQND
jgi:hypothetical protein